MRRSDIISHLVGQLDDHLASVNLVVAACPGQSFHSTLDGPGQALAEFLVHLAQPFTLKGIGRINVPRLGQF